MTMSHKDWRAHPFYRYDPYYHDIDPGIAEFGRIKESMLIRAASLANKSLIPDPSRRRHTK